MVVSNYFNVADWLCKFREKATYSFFNVAKTRHFGLLERPNQTISYKQSAPLMIRMSVLDTDQNQESVEKLIMPYHRSAFQYSHNPRTADHYTLRNGVRSYVPIPEDFIFPDYTEQNQGNSNKWIKYITKNLLFLNNVVWKRNIYFQSRKYLF